VKVENNTSHKSEFIKLKDDKWLADQRVAGKVAAGALSLLEGLVKEKTTKSLLELDKIAEEYIRDNGCTPTFLNYKGFPNSVCISVNKQLVHGIPTDYKLIDGDLVSFDLGATYKGAVGDTAITVIYGQPKSQEHIDLINATQKALYEAIASINVGKKLGIIGHTISKVAKKYALSVIDQYGGHGIDRSEDGFATPHAQPFVSNSGNLEVGIRFQPYMTLAIEPLFVLGRSSKTEVVGKWDVICEELCAHFEHTIFIHEDKVEIITLRENEKI
jgi:methionyl aminopeptidase